MVSCRVCVIICFGMRIRFVSSYMVYNALYIIPSSRLGAILSRLGAILSRLGAILGPSWGRLEPSWGHLGAVLGRFGREDEYGMKSMMKEMGSRAKMSKQLKQTRSA